MRIAILGGTFDPIHNGHLAAAQSVSSTFEADQVLFVPAFTAPHKESSAAASPFHRFAMVALAIEPFGNFRASTIEVDELRKRYTVETLGTLRERFPGAEFVFILGTDMYRDFETWRDYRRIFTLTHLAVVNRPGYAFRADLAPHRELEAGDRVTLPGEPSVFHLPFVEQPISSSAVRDACRRGDNPGRWLPAPVWSYIERNQLYA